MIHEDGKIGFNLCKVITTWELKTEVFVQILNTYPRT